MTYTILENNKHTVSLSEVDGFLNHFIEAGKNLELASLSVIVNKVCKQKHRMISSRRRDKWRYHIEKAEIIQTYAGSGASS